MARLGRVNEKRRRPGRGQGRGDLAGDVPRLAHAADHHAAGALEHQPAGADERLVQMRRQLADSLGSIRSTRNAVSSRRSLCSIFVIPVCSISLPEPAAPPIPGSSVRAGAPLDAGALTGSQVEARARTRVDAAGRRSARQSGWDRHSGWDDIPLAIERLSGFMPQIFRLIPVQDFPVLIGLVASGRRLKFPRHARARTDPGTAGASIATVGAVRPACRAGRRPGRGRGARPGRRKPGGRPAPSTRAAGDRGGCSRSASSSACPSWRALRSYVFGLGRRRSSTIGLVVLRWWCSAERGG